MTERTDPVIDPAVGSDAWVEAFWPGADPVEIRRQLRAALDATETKPNPIAEAVLLREHREAVVSLTRAQIRAVKRLVRVGADLGDREACSRLLSEIREEVADPDSQIVPQMPQWWWALEI